MSQDLDFRMDKTKPQEDDCQFTFWGWDGKGSSESKNALAKVLKDNHTGTEKYFVRCASFGSDRGTLYNPRGMHSLPLTATSIDGKPKYDFHKVSKKCFDLYFNFLQTHNEVALTQAQQVYNGETH